MELSRREFTGLLATAPALLLAGCGGGDEPAQKTSTLPSSPYWVTESVTENGTEYDLEDYGLNTADFLVLVLNADGSGQSYSMGEMGGTFQWAESSGTVTLTSGENQQVFQLEDDKLVGEMQEGNSILSLTLKNVSEMPAALSNGFNPLENFKPTYDIAQTLAMSNFVLSNRYVNDGSMLYGFHFADDEDGYAGLYALQLSMNNGNIHLDSKTPLDAECGAYYLAIVEGYLYYLRYARESNACSICRLPLAGGEKEVLREGDADFLVVRDSKLYYTNAEHHACVSDLDGSNEEVLIAKECYYPYPVDGDYILYQDDADGERLHVFHRPSGADRAMTADVSYSPVIDGSTLWYTRKAEDESCHLCRLDLTSYNAETGFATEEGDKPVSSVVALGVGHVFLQEYGRETSHLVARDQWQQLTWGDGNLESGYGLCEYLSQDYEVHRSINEAGNTSGIHANVPGSAIGFPIW